jgi:hypothetical protein
MNHNLLCPAAICNDDPNPNYKNEVVWLPGEPICKRTPLEKYQIIQNRINEGFKKGGFQDSDGFTASQLESTSF